MATKLNNTERIQLLESDLAKIKQDMEVNHETNTLLFEEVMKAITGLTTTVGDLSSKVGNWSNKDDKKLKRKEDSWGYFDGSGQKGTPKIGFGSFSDSDEETYDDHKKTNGEGGSGKTGNNYRNSNHRNGDFRKIKMPVFEDEDAYGWIYRVERYFGVQEIEEKNHLRAAALCIEGAALSWYRWSEGRNPFQSWDSWVSLKTRLLERFQPSYEGNVYEQFLGIRQEGTAREYVSKFEQLAGQLIDLSEKVLEGTFINGLKIELRSVVRVMQPETLNQAMRVAIMLEENRVSDGFSRSGQGLWMLVLLRVAKLGGKFEG